jgi:hypothetical protein
MNFSRNGQARIPLTPGPRDPTECDLFNEEWVRWFPGDGPVGQSTMMTPLQRRAGFRVSIGVIAEA